MKIVGRSNVIRPLCDKALRHFTNTKPATTNSYKDVSSHSAKLATNNQPYTSAKASPLAKYINTDAVLNKMSFSDEILPEDKDKMTSATERYCESLRSPNSEQNHLLTTCLQDVAYVLSCEKVLSIRIAKCPQMLGIYNRSIFDKHSSTIYLYPYPQIGGIDEDNVIYNITSSASDALFNDLNRLRSPEKATKQSKDFANDFLVHLQKDAGHGELGIAKLIYDRIVKDIRLSSFFNDEEGEFAVRSIYPELMGKVGLMYFMDPEEIEKNQDQIGNRNIPDINQITCKNPAEFENEFRSTIEGLNKWHQLYRELVRP